MVLDVGAWRGLRLTEPVDGGHRAEVWEGCLDGRRVAVRRSRRRPESLAWELDLLESLAGAGFHVPTVIRADNGSRSAGGIVVHEWIDGRDPETADDWRLVANQLQRLHDEFGATPQRPGCRCVTELDRRGASVDADLQLVPDDAAELVLEVFRSCAGAPVSVVHGDPARPNIRIDGDDQVWLLDWDASRVDLVWHDLANLGVQVLDDEHHMLAMRLADAWHAVNAWRGEPNYARVRLGNLTRLVREVPPPSRVRGSRDG